MAGSKFQYDESGGTFFYFLLSFLALLVVPGTYYFWPKEPRPGKYATCPVPSSLIVRCIFSLEETRPGDKRRCHCDACGKKSNLLRTKEPWQKAKSRFIKLALIFGWIALAATAYKVAHLQHDYVNWDPFEILGIDPGSSIKEIKRAYHKLSLVYHPDKETGDPKKFMMISKAYAALTDDEARKNWETYGNPDGPGATSFGIALPSWIVEKENSILVLGAYALVFMIALPTVVGIWWYRSVKYGGDEVLLDTTQLYYYFIHRTPHMISKRVIMIIAASPEFEKSHNSEIVERPSDNYEVPQLIREIPNLNEKNRERPLCFGYSIKARALLYAHLSRMKLPPNSLEIDKNYVVKKCPVLIQEFVQCVAQLTMLALAGKISRTPSLETLEAAMKWSSLIVQAMWDSKSPLLQLPHIGEESLRYFSNKKRTVKTLQQLAQMRHDERRIMLKSLTDEQYEDIVVVLGNMPHLEVEVKCEVLDDEDSSNITAGSIVTVTVGLTRKPLSTLFVDDKIPEGKGAQQGNSLLPDEAEDETPEQLTNANTTADAADTPKHRVWEKSYKKKGKGAKNKKRQIAQKKKQQQQQKKEPIIEDTNEKSKLLEHESDDEQQQQQQQNSDLASASDSDFSTDSDADQDSDNEKDAQRKNKDAAGGDDEDEDDDWEKFNSRSTNKNKALEAKAKISHTVHCPYFPEEKQEFWWIYLSDRKRQALTSIPVLLTNLVEKEQVELKLTAPGRPGIYSYCVVVRSDSYVDFDVTKHIKVSFHTLDSFDIGID